jgi:hypothetical protein
VLANVVDFPSSVCYGYEVFLMFVRVAAISSSVRCPRSSHSPAPLILKLASLRQLFYAAWHALLLVQSKPSPPKATHGLQALKMCVSPVLVLACPTG